MRGPPDHGGHPFGDASPCLVRVSGLPALSMAEFSGSLLNPLLGELREVRSHLGGARDAMVDRLYEAVGRSPAELRGFLLQAKRDCYNGRRLGRLQDDSHWPRLEEVGGRLVREILELEEQASKLQERFEEAYRSQRAAERTALLRLLDDHPQVLRGIALGSSVLLENLHRLREGDPRNPDRRERKLEKSLLRYLSRAALKLSPFSSLTRLGLGILTDQRVPGTVSLSGGPWEERSLVRVRRYFLDQLLSMLSRFRLFRSRFRLRRNETLHRLRDGRFRFLRPGFWDPDERDPDSGGLDQVRSSLVSLEFRGPLLEWIQELPEEGVTWKEAEEDLIGRFGGEAEEPRGEEVRSSLGQLLAVGFLVADPPWTSDDLRVEEKISDYLEDLPAHPELTPLELGFRKLVKQLDAYPRASDPAAAVREIHRRLQRLWELSAPLGGLDPEVRFTPRREYFFNEDVFLIPRDDASGAELEVEPSRAGVSSPQISIARVNRGEIREILEDLAPLVRLGDLLSLRHDFLHALADLAREFWPGRREVDLLSLFARSKGLLKEFVRFERGVRDRAPSAAEAFNPRNLEVAEKLRRHRQEVLDRLGDCFERRSGGWELKSRGLQELVERTPDRYSSDRGPLLFLQPLAQGAGEGARWALNQLAEGAGRFSSRYTAVMDEDTRSRWSDHFVSRSLVEWDGEPAELLDLLCPAGQTVNLHAPHTHRVLRVPGESSSLPHERQLRLPDLRVRLMGPEVLPALVDSQGRRLAPVHLGGIVHRVLPTLFKFLTLLGPGRRRHFIPRKPGRRRGEVEILDRCYVGSVVVARKTWVLDTSAVRERLGGRSPASRHRAMDDWRTEHSVPRQVFLEEPLSDRPNPQYKPQFIDFGSPILSEIFQDALELGRPRLRLAEALPDPSQAVPDSKGVPWLVEVQVDGQALKKPFDVSKSDFRSTTDWHRTPVVVASGAQPSS